MEKCHIPEKDAQAWKALEFTDGISDYRIASIYNITQAQE